MQGTDDTKGTTGQTQSAQTTAQTSAQPAAEEGDIKDGKFNIPKVVVQKYPELIELIKGTESMNDDERQYWFQILPIMTDEQIAKFREILQNEKDQLAKLDKEYEQELKKINERHSAEWKASESKEDREAREKKEKAADVEEKAKEEELLKKLSNA
jgi:hypothetical protein